jgi:transposase
MEETAANRCPGCQRLQAQLEAQRLELESQQLQLESQRQQIEALQATVATLQGQLAKARKTSSTSSKPPSSDIVKPPAPPPPPGQQKRSQGGQPGHPKHERAAFAPEALTSPPHQYTLEICPDCGHGVHPIPFEPKVIQQIDIREMPLLIEEHRAGAYCCQHCQKFLYAPLPASVEAGGLVGPRLTALIAYLKGFCHASFATIRKFLRDVAQVSISRGLLAKVIGKVSAALEESYRQLLQSLAEQRYLNIDETGHKDRGQRMWTWCFRASLYTLFKIDPHRSAEVLFEVLGREFEGVIGCDFFSAYRRYMRECGLHLQFCLAHLIRDVKFLLTLPDKSENAYGERLRQALKGLFGVIHQRQKLSETEFQRRLQAAREEVLRQGTQNVPGGRHSQTMAKRWQQYGQSYFVFITTPGIEPTNNLAEQAIRFVVIDRLITQGTRGEKGQRFCERIWTVIATCAQQGRSVFDYLCKAVEAHFTGEQGPTLLPEEQ